MQWVLCAVIGLLAGVGGGLFGIGGGIIIVPLLIIAFGMSQQMAQGTSLVALLAPVGLLGVMNYWNSKMVDLPKGVVLALGFIGGAYIGSKIAVDLDPDTMRKSFAVFLVIVGFYMYFRK